MKVWGSVLLLGLAACATSAPPAPPPAESHEARRFVEGLRVERDYRPAPQGSEVVSRFIELPRGAYVAQGWAWDCWPAASRCEPVATRCVPYGLYRTVPRWDPCSW